MSDLRAMLEGRPSSGSVGDDPWLHSVTTHGFIERGPGSASQGFDKEAVQEASTNRAETVLTMEVASHITSDRGKTLAVRYGVICEQWRASLAV